jgi:Tfp pilus assembly protein PilO
VKKDIASLKASADAWLAPWKKRVQALWSRFHAMSPRERRIIVVAGVVLGVLFVDTAVIKPMRGHLSSVERKIRETEVIAIRNLRNTAQKADLNTLYQRLQQDIPDLRAGDEEIRASLLRDVESFARSNEVYLADVKPQISTESDLSKEFSVRLQVECRMDQLLSFFADLAQTRKLYAIESFRIYPHPEDVNKVKASLAVTRVVLVS